MKKLLIILVPILFSFTSNVDLVDYLNNIRANPAKYQYEDLSRHSTATNPLKRSKYLDSLAYVRAKYMASIGDLTHETYLGSGKYFSIKTGILDCLLYSQGLHYQTVDHFLMEGFATNLDEDQYGHRQCLLGKGTEIGIGEYYIGDEKYACVLIR
jgi:uncharacterized protein YkwD